MASITMQTNKRNNLLIINAKQIILEDEVLYNGHVIVESDGIKIIKLIKVYIMNMMIIINLMHV